MAGLTDTQLADFAARLTLSRAVFEDHYDRLAAHHGGTVFKLIAFARDPGALHQPSPEKTRLDITAALIRARADGWLDELMMELFQIVSATTPPEDAPEQTATLQAAIKQFRTFTDATRIEAGTLAASRRSCSIARVFDDPDIPDDQIGSGFLVGPNLVLTNFHVIADFVTIEAGAATPNPEIELEFRFDHYPETSKTSSRICALARDWLVAFGPAAPALDDLDVLTTRLDFAVIRLRETPGHALGYYRLQNVDWPHPAHAPAAALADTAVEVWQFPARQPMKVAAGALHPVPDALGLGPLPEPARPPRLMHDAHTLDGSSGGLVMDASMRPVALHTGASQSFAAPGGAARLNFAVPLPMIHAACAPAYAAALDAAPISPAWDTEGLPIIGRGTLLRLINEATRGAIDIITVLTRPDAAGARIPNLGRTFTASILRAILPPEDHHVMHISSALVASDDAVLTARRLVAQVNPDAAATFTTIRSDQVLDKTLTRLLVEDTVAAMVAAIPDRTIWIMIDDLDAHTIKTQLSASNFLMELYLKATSGAALKFILVGLEAPLKGLPDDHVGIEDLTREFDNRDVEDWLQGTLASGNWPLQVSRRIGLLLRSAGESSHDPKTGRMEAIARFITAHAKPAFQRRGGMDGGGS